MDKKTKRIKKKIPKQKQKQKQKVIQKVNVSVSKILKETIGFVKSAVPSNIVIKSRIPLTTTNVYIIIYIVIKFFC